MVNLDFLPNSIQLSISILGLLFILFIAVWTIIITIQLIVVAYGSTIWINSIDNQLAKEVNNRIDTSFSAGSRFSDYWFKFPFIYKRAKTKDKKFYIIMTLNSIYAYTVAVVFVLVFVGVIPIDSISS